MPTAAIHNGVVIERNVMVPMRDGVRLATDVYRPDKPGQFPVLLQRLPYGKQILDRVFLDPTQTAQRDYVVVVQDSRGRFDSEGEWYPFHCEINDGYDAVEWAAVQPWSNGKVGMFSGSYIGATQWLAAIAQPPHLVTMVPATATSDFHDSWVYHTGGAFDLIFNVGWAIAVSGNTAQRLGIKDPTVEQAGATLAAMGERMAQDPAAAMATLEELRSILQPLFSFRPLRELPSLKRLAPWFTDWIDHPEADPYWQSINFAAQYNKVHTPALHITGWYDVFLGGSLANYLGMIKHGPTPAVRRGQKLIIGPWYHGPFTPQTTRIGEVDFGPQAGIDFTAVQWRWFDHWLKGVNTGIMDEAPIRLFVMGDNAWRDEWEWPLARTQWTRYYLHSKGQANTLTGDGTLATQPPEAEKPDRFTYDPRDPVPTCGGCLLPIGAAPGMFDQREVEARPDVLVYTSPPLSEDVEVTGPVTVELWASTSAPDTDFTAKLVDVYPDGRAMNLCEGIIRARYRASQETPSLVTPGAVYPFRIDLWATSTVFKAGHRIRLEISSSNFPHFEPNPNTGHALGQDDILERADQEVFHDARHPSHIMLPVIPRS